MKRCSVVVFLGVYLSLTIQSAPAQTGWQWQYPLPQGNSLYNVDYFSGSMAIAVGAASTVIRTADGGSTWTVTVNAAGLSETLRAVCVIDALTAIAVGEGGTIIRTTDGGITWRAQASGTSISLYDVTFSTASTGYAVGGTGTILKTTDGGINWLPLSSGSGATLFGASFAHPDIGTVVGSEGTILRTTDAGSSWTNQTSGTTSPLYAVQFITVNTGYAVGNGLVLKTTDGGATWNTLATPASGYAIVDLSFIDADNGFIIGNTSSEAEPAIFISTEDGGSSWSSYTAPISVFGVSRRNYSRGLAVGEMGAIRRTSDGGITWPSIGGPASTAFPASAVVMRGLDFWDIHKGAAVMSVELYGGYYRSTVLETADGGDTWAESEVPPGTSPGIGLLDIAYADETTVYAVGNGNSVFDVGGLVYRSLNGGANWGEVWVSSCWPTNPECVGFLYGIDFSDAEHGVAVGDGGWILTIRSGHVGQVATGTDVTLNGVAMPDAPTVFAVGEGGTILRSTNGGDTWVPQVSGVTASLNRVHFSDANNGTVVGNSGTVLRTWNGGDGWYQQTSGTTDNLVGVSFSNPMVGFIVGQSGTILETTNGGATWTVELGPIGELVDVHAINEYNVTIVGGHWNILAKRGFGPPGAQASCPADMIVPAISTIPSVSLVGFRITNVGGISCAYDYYVTAEGPATLVDKGNPASLSGTTPTLAPGATYYPPEAGLLIPDIRTHAQEFVTYHAYMGGDAGIGDACTTVITFEPPVPVFINAFDAKAFESGVDLSWEVASDDDVAGFKVYRGLEGEVSNEDVTAGSLIPAEARTYSDKNVSGGRTYQYTLGVVLADRSEMRSQTVTVRAKAYEFALQQNHPNPFNPSTTISFTLPEKTKATLSIYDVEGRLVRTLVDEAVGEGYQERVWDGRDTTGSAVSSGVYFYRLTVANRTLTRKAVLLR